MSVSSITEIYYFHQNFSECMSFLGMTAKDLAWIMNVSKSSLDFLNRGDSSSMLVTKVEKIVETLCTTADEICGGLFASDLKKTVSIQETFIRRAGGVDAESAKKTIEAAENRIPVRGVFPESEAYILLKGAYTALAKGIDIMTVKENLEPFKDVGGIFRNNFLFLMNATDTKYDVLNKGTVMSTGTGISNGTISRINAGGEPSLKTALDVARFFRVTISDLLTGNLRDEGYSVSAFMDGSAAVLTKYEGMERKTEPQSERELSREEIKSFLKSRILGLCRHQNL